MSNVYKEYENKRKEHTDEIVEHIRNGGNVVIVAGPGTGKTHLFKEIVKNFQLDSGKKILVLSFINALVDDLKREFCQDKEVEVRTLHSFAKKVLGDSVPTTEPMLSKIIAEDFLIYKGQAYKEKKIKKETEDIETLFNTMEIELPQNKEIKKFYEKRKNFYNRVSFNDMAYSLVSYLKQNPNEIPNEYALLIIDEFQDFCPLEAELVNLLSQKTKSTIIVGDDDQIVYNKATPELLRKKYLSLDTKYKSFTLPFCGRCTKCIVNFINKVVENARNGGKLEGRIDKEYKYFKSKEKDQVSQQYPEVICKYYLNDNQIPTNIHSRIQEICRHERPDNETFMVIVPIKNKIEKIKDSLVKFGYKNVLVKEMKKYDDLTYGVGILLNSNNGVDNFGWRLVISEKNSENLKEIVKNSIDDPSKHIFDYCPEFKKECKQILTLLRKLVKTKKPCLTEEKFKLLKTGEKEKWKSFSNKDISALITFCNSNLEIDWLNILMTDLQNVTEFLEGVKDQQNLFTDVKIILTTPQSSKGLSANHVFITDCTSQVMFKKEENKEICTLLVAISRAEKSLTIFTKEEFTPSILPTI